MSTILLSLCCVQLRKKLCSHPSPPSRWVLQVSNFPLSIQCDGAWVVAAHRVVMVTVHACLRPPHRPYRHLSPHSSIGDEFNNHKTIYFSGMVTDGSHTKATEPIKFLACAVLENIHTPPMEVFFICTPLPPGNSSFASYFASKILTSKTPLPLRFSDVLPWGGYGFFQELYNCIM